MFYRSFYTSCYFYEYFYVFKHQKAAISIGQEKKYIYTFFVMSQRFFQYPIMVILWCYFYSDKFNFYLSKIAHSN